MDNVLQQIIIDEINKIYETEKNFYENKLNITQQSWNRWKRGDRGFSDDNTLILKSLFSDYEWMLIQKIVTEFKSNNETSIIDNLESPYDYYLETKKTIAKEWIKHGADIELIDEKNDEDNKKELGTKLIVKLHYDLDTKQADDEITFHLNNIKGKIKDKKKKRKKWFNKNEENMY